MPSAVGTVNVRGHYVNPADRDEYLRLLERDGVVVDSEVKALKTDGTVMDCVRTSVARRDEAGHVVTIQTVTRDVTEDRQRRAALADELARRRILLEQSRDGIVVLDKTGKVVEANLSFARMLGYSLEEVTQLHVWDWEFLYPLDRLKEMLRAIDEAGDHFETQHRRKDGTIYDVEISTNAAVFAGQKLIFCVCRDVSAQKQAERTLRDSEQRYRLIADDTMDVIWRMDMDMRFTYVNPAVERMLGFTADELIGTLLAEYCSSSEFQRMRGMIVDWIEHPSGDTGVRFETVMFGKDGAESPVEIRAKILTDAAGRPYAIHGVTRDITERKRAEEGLRESEEKYRLLFEQSMDAVAIYAVDGTLLDANPAHLRLFGLASDDIGRRGVLSLYANPADRDEFLRVLDRDGAVVDQETILMKKDGTVMDCVRSAIARRDNSGRLVAAQTVTRDVSAHKRAEQELRESELRFRALVEHTGLGMTITRMDGAILDCNDVIPRMLGYTKDEFLRLRVPDLYVDQGDRERVLAQALRDGFVRDEVAEFRRKDQSSLFVSMTSALVPMAGETVVVSQFLDITERKAAEGEVLLSREELRRSAEQLRELTTHLEEARENERTGIARELHDQLGQALTALNMDLDGMLTPADMTGEDLSLSTALTAWQPCWMRWSTMCAESHRTCVPGILDDLGLVAAIEWQLDQFRERSGIDCRLDAHADDSALDRPRTTALFRVFQELLTNVARHANAAHLWVGVRPG